MRLIIRSPSDAVLDMDTICVLFVRSEPVAVVRKIDDGDIWEAYQTFAIDIETADIVRCWLDGYISTSANLKSLNMDTLLEVIKSW